MTDRQAVNVFRRHNVAMRDQIFDMQRDRFVDHMNSVINAFTHTGDT